MLLFFTSSLVLYIPLSALLW